MPDIIGAVVLCGNRLVVDNAILSLHKEVGVYGKGWTYHDEDDPNEGCLIVMENNNPTHFSGPEGLPQLLEYLSNK